MERQRWEEPGKRTEEERRSEEVEMSKKSTPLWREARFQIKMYKAHQVEMSKQCTPFVVARSTFPSQKCKKLTGTEHFWTFRCRFALQAQGILHLVKSEQNVRVFIEVSKTMAGVGHLKRIWTDEFRVAGAIQETHELDVLGDQGGDFLRGVACWSMRSSAL